jgi:hypothetical protein
MSLLLKHPASTVVYKSGSTYIAESYDGKLLSTSTSDASIVINAAIAAIPGAVTTGMGGKVHIYPAKYDCKTQIELDILTTSYHGVELEGEGFGTMLDFTPSSTVTDAILLRMANCGLSNMRIRANSNVTNLVNAKALGSGFRHDYGWISHVMFDGGNVADITYGSSSVITGQNGLIITGDTANKSLFFWKINDCDFRQLDIGIHCFDAWATSTHQTNNTFMFCETAEKISGGQHNISNIWVQGDATHSRYGIYLTSEGSGSSSICNISNINTELSKTGVECAAVYIDTGVRFSNVNNVHNASEDRVNFFSVLDKSFKFTSYWDRLEYPFRRPFGWHAVNQAAGTDRAMGLFQGRGAAISVGTGTSAAATTTVAMGTSRTYSTGATQNSISGMRMDNNTLAIRGLNPVVACKFKLNHTSSVRFFVGFTSNNSAPASAADPLANLNGFGLWLDTAVSTNWKIAHNDGDSTGDYDDTSIASDINVHNIWLAGDDVGTRFKWKLDNWRADNNVSTEIPSQTQGIGAIQFFIENTTGTDVSVGLGHLYLEHRG